MFESSPSVMDSQYNGVTPYNVTLSNSTMDKGQGFGSSINSWMANPDNQNLLMTLGTSLMASGGDASKLGTALMHGMNQYNNNLLQKQHMGLYERAQDTAEKRTALDERKLNQLDALTERKYPSNPQLNVAQIPGSNKLFVRYGNTNHVVDQTWQPGEAPQPIEIPGTPDKMIQTGANKWEILKPPPSEPNGDWQLMKDPTSPTGWVKVNMRDNTKIYGAPPPQENPLNMLLNNAGGMQGMGGGPPAQTNTPTTVPNPFSNPTQLASQDMSGVRQKIDKTGVILRPNKAPQGGRLVGKQRGTGKNVYQIGNDLYVGE